MVVMGVTELVTVRGVIVHQNITSQYENVLKR